jgi:hypothetical protein
MFRFRTCFLKLLNLFRHFLGLLGREISPTYTGQHTHTHPCLERDSNPRSQCSSGRREYVPQTARPLGPASFFLSLYIILSSCAMSYRAEYCLLLQMFGTPSLLSSGYQRLFPWG